MLVSCYLKKGAVYIPTEAFTPDRLYVAIEPVSVAPVGDLEALRRALVEAVLRGNPTIPTPDFSKGYKPILLKYADAKTWSAFERGAFTWDIEEKRGIYRIVPGRRAADRGWEDDLDNAIVLPPGTTVEQLCARAASVIQDRAKNLDPCGPAPP